MGALRVPSAISAVARPLTVSPGAGARRGMSTATPAGHHDGNNTRSESGSPTPRAEAEAQSRPGAACWSDAESGMSPWPAACQSNGGDHGPKLKPKQTGSSAAVVCARDVCVMHITNIHPTNADATNAETRALVAWRRNAVRLHDVVLSHVSLGAETVVAK